MACMCHETSRLRTFVFGSDTSHSILFAEFKALEVVNVGAFAH